MNSQWLIQQWVWAPCWLPDLDASSTSNFFNQVPQACDITSHAVIHGYLATPYACAWLFIFAFTFILRWRIITTVLNSNVIMLQPDRGVLDFTKTEPSTRSCQTWWGRRFSSGGVIGYFSDFRESVCFSDEQRDAGLIGEQSWAEQREKELNSLTFCVSARSKVRT